MNLLTHTTSPSATDEGALVLDCAVAPHAICTVLCAVGTEGLTAVVLGPDRATVLQRLKERFGPVRLTEGGAESLQAMSFVQQLMSGQPTAACPRLAVKGTSFERLVWQALMNIPAGSTATYGAVATAIGRPRSARAVGAACSRNTLAVIIPCHRVGYAQGTRMHYRWGPHIKARLLEVEAASQVTASP